MHQMAQLVEQRVISHLASLRDRGVGSWADRSFMEALLRQPLAEEGTGFPQVVEEFERNVAAHATCSNHPCFLAFVPGAPTFISILGDWLCSGYNFFAGVWLEAAGPAQLELIVLDCPPITDGAYSSLLPEAVDGVILVVQAERTRPAVIAHAKDRIQQAGGQVLGAVLNQRTNYIPDFLYKLL